MRTRENEQSEWSKPDYYKTRKKRDDNERMCRILGGLRTHSYEEKVTQERFSEIFE
jgi:hypothetical protein